MHSASLGWIVVRDPEFRAAPATCPPLSQLLLEPLSYHADIERLCGRADPSSWDLSPLFQWAEDSDSATPQPRVLCVTATAGQGKSTASALLCKAATGGSSQADSPVAAYHFAKFSDARRLDPVRIVKSLAYQLAMRWDQAAGAKQLPSCCQPAAGKLGPVS